MTATDFLVLLMLCILLISTGAIGILIVRLSGHQRRLYNKLVEKKKADLTKILESYNGSLPKHVIEKYEKEIKDLK